MLNIRLYNVNVYLIIILLIISILKNVNIYLTNYFELQHHKKTFINLNKVYFVEIWNSTNSVILETNNYSTNYLTNLSTNNLKDSKLIILNESKSHSFYIDYGIYVNITNYSINNHSNEFIKLVRDLFIQTNSSNIINFGGKQVKEIFDPLSIYNGVSLTNKNKFKSWSDIVQLINKSKNLRSDLMSVHVHNELIIGDFFQYILQNSKKLSKKNKISLNDEEYFLKGFDMNQSSIVMTNSVDENWGFLSTRIGTRTTKWINMTNHLLIHGANYNTVKYFLNSNKLVLLVCNTHVDPMIGAHSKVISLPLGIKATSIIYDKVIELSKMNVNKTRLLLISNSGWGDRKMINKQVSDAFHGIIDNSYRKNSNIDHYKEVAESLFILCPSGLGFDTYRLWETLILGSIPIVESNKGFDRTYSNLPVLVIKNYSDLTPELLLNSYPCFYKYRYQYRYNHLLKNYWINLINKSVKFGNIKHVSENHPFVNKYCNYLN